MQEDFLFTILHRTLRRLYSKSLKYGRDNKSIKKKQNKKFPKKKSIFSILELKRAKNSYEGYPTVFFPGTDKNFKLPPNFSKIFQNIPKKTHLNQN
jgi:hypothetical protein